MSYVLGESEESNRKADMGNVFHKIMEVLSYREDFKDESGSFKYPFDIEEVCQGVWEYFQPKRLDWQKSDPETIKGWVYKTLEMDDGAYDPRTLNIIEAEKHFSYELPYEWAKYSFKLNGKKKEGQLSLKGTIDLVVGHNNYVELLDWKTGKRYNWAKGSVKDYDDLKKDNQLLLYYYVARKIYNKPVVVTIVYINDGGAYTIPFDDDDLITAENMLREKFEKIKNEEPQTIFPAPFCRFCSFGKSYYDEPALTKAGDPKVKCLQIKHEVYQIGVEKTVAKYIQNQGKHLFSYGAGGGQSTEGREKRAN